jgi:shikimate kinase
MQQTPSKVLLVLIGPKGSGKSFLGKAISDANTASFLSIEPLFLAVQKGRSNMNPGKFINAIPWLLLLI